jgi:hypothetical protein
MQGEVFDFFVTRPNGFVSIGDSITLVRTPEPETPLFLGIGLLALLAFWKRRITV